jgi:hypothetical protein
MNPTVNAMESRCQQDSDSLSPKRDVARNVTAVEPYQAELRQRIRAAMAAAHCTPKQLAKALRHPHAQTVHRWLSDDPKKHRAISINNLRKIAKMLDVAVDTLDPDGTEAYDPANRPEHMRRGFSRNPDIAEPDSHTATNLLHSGTPLASVGVSPMPDMPDAELFDRFSGLWRAMDHGERQNVYDVAARHIGAHPGRAVRAKNK